MIGETISHYKILEKLGEGGMGVVYKALDTALDRFVALKFLPRQLTTTPDDQTRFLQEAKAVAALNHPNVCTIHGIEEHGGELFIVMEYLEGTTLRKKIRAVVADQCSRLSPDETISYAIQIAEGLRAAHKKGIIHRDVNTSNIMVTEDRLVRIMDFGLAKRASITQLTRTGATAGTVPYMSPEQARGEKVDLRTDIWSFGIVLYEMLSGELPFKSEYEQGLVYLILNEKPRPLSAVQSDVSPELEKVVTKCLEKEAADRYQDTDQLLADLYRIKGIAPETGLTWKALLRNYRKLAVPAGAGTAVVLLAAAYLLFKGTPSPDETGRIPDNSLAVMYFDNQSGEKDLDKMLVTMVSTNLARYKDLDVASSQRLFDILKLLGKQDAQTIDRSVATEVAHRARVKSMLLGSIIRLGDKLRILAQLLDVESGNIIASAQVDGERAEDVFAMVDTLTEKVRASFRLAVASTGAQPLRIADASTSSYESFKHYQRGLEHLWRWEVDEAAKEFNDALAIDSTFALAHIQLIVAETNRGLEFANPLFDMSSIHRSLEHARSHSANLPEKERGMIEVFGALCSREFDKANTLATSLVSRYPNDKEVANVYGVVSLLSGSSDQFIRSQERLLEIDPGLADPHNGLAYVYSWLGDDERAVAEVKKYLALLGVDNAWDSAMEIYFHAGRFDEIRAMCNELKKSDPNSPTPAYLIYIELFEGRAEKAREMFRQELKDNPGALRTNLGATYILEGRYKDALVEFNEILRLAQNAGRSDRETRAHFLLGKMFLAQGNYSAAVEQFGEAKKLSASIYDQSFNPVPMMAEYFTGVTLIKKGDLVEAQNQVTKFQLFIQKSRYRVFYDNYYQMLLAELQIARGDGRSAGAALAKVSMLVQTHFPRCSPLIAAIDVLNGDVEAAINVYKSSLNKIHTRNEYSGGDYFFYFLERSKVYHNVARLYELKGDKTQALEYYTKALAQWKNADTDFPEVIDARARFANLKGIVTP